MAAHACVTPSIQPVHAMHAALGGAAAGPGEHHSSLPQDCFRCTPPRNSAPPTHTHPPTHTYTTITHPPPPHPTPPLHTPTPPAHHHHAQRRAAQQAAQRVGQLRLVERSQAAEGHLLGLLLLQWTCVFCVSASATGRGGRAAGRAGSGRVLQPGTPPSWSRSCCTMPHRRLCTGTPGAPQPCHMAGPQLPTHLR